MIKLLVTGATGFIGNEFLKSIDLTAYNPICLVRNPAKAKIHANGISYIKFDIDSDYSEYQKLPEADVVIHIAARTSDEKPDLKKSILTNIESTKKLIQYSKDKGIKKIIYLSTMAENSGIYSKTKREAEELLKKSCSKSLSYTIIRPGLVYGNTDKGMFYKMESLVKKLPIVPIIGNGKYIFQTIYVKDVVDVILKCISTKKSDNKTYEIASLDKLPYDQIIDEIIKKNGKFRIKFHIPVWPMVLAISILSKFVKLPINADNIKGLTNARIIDCKEAIKDLGFCPRDFREVYPVLGPKRVAIVGFGKMGLLHATLLRNIPECKIVAICDPQKLTKLKMRLLNHKCNYYADYRKMLSKEKLDAVFLCTPPNVTQRICEDIADKGIAIFAEKPIATDYENSKRLYDLVKKHKVNNSVGFMKLYNPFYAKMKEILSSGKFGSIKELDSCIYIHSLTKKSDKWYFKKSISGGGVVVNLGIHLLSMVLGLLGKPSIVSSKLKSIYSDVEDEADIKLSYDDGKTARLDISQVKEGYNTLYLSIKLKCEKGTIEMTNDSLIIRQDGIPEKKYSLTDLNLADAIFFENYDYYLQDYDFIKNLSSGKNVECNSFEDNLPIHEVIDKIYSRNEKIQ